MLSTLRSAAGTWVAKLLLLLLVVSFAIWGISGQVATGFGGNSVVTAGDTDVTPIEYRLAYDRQLSVLSQQFGTRLTREQAKDAAELIEVEYDELPAVADTAKALAAGAAQVHPEAPGNLAFDWHFGDAAKVAAAFAKAARTVRLELVNNRVICNPMEPRACVAEWDAAAGRLTLHTGTQGVWMPRDVLARSSPRFDRDGYLAFMRSLAGLERYSG